MTVRIEGPGLTRSREPIDRLVARIANRASEERRKARPDVSPSADAPARLQDVTDPEVRS
jgi:hypothetical protein